MTYPEAIARLSATRRFGMKLGLDPMRRLAERLGRPQESLRFIHLAGSNGKGSTAAFCEAGLRAGGLRVGLYTSPHLVSVRERIQIDRVPIPEQAFAEGMTAVAAAAEGEPTFFELMTALALWYFARERVDWVVWETGLGGRLDATNIVQPSACIITSITLEHMEYLGRTLREIATEKAGIIKPGVPVVCGDEQGEVRDVVRDTCAGRGAPYLEIPRDAVENLGLRQGRQWARLDRHEYELGLLGAHQVRNAACALRALQALPKPPGSAVIARGLAATTWAGRFQIVSEAPLVILDGAHNPAALEELLKTWRDFLGSRGLPARPAELVFAMSADKDIAGMARLAGEHFSAASFPRLTSDRAADPRMLAEHFPGIAEPRFPSSMAAWRPRGIPALVTGSLFLAGEMLAHLAGASGDLNLNERLESLPSAP